MEERSSLANPAPPADPPPPSSNPSLSSANLLRILAAHTLPAPPIPVGAESKSSILISERSAEIPPQSEDSVIPDTELRTSLHQAIQTAIPHMAHIGSQAPASAHVVNELVADMKARSRNARVDIRRRPCDREGELRVYVSFNLLNPLSDLIEQLFPNLPGTLSWASIDTGKHKADLQLLWAVENVNPHTGRTERTETKLAVFELRTPMDLPSTRSDDAVSKLHVHELDVGIRGFMLTRKTVQPQPCRILDQVRGSTVHESASFTDLGSAEGWTVTAVTLRDRLCSRERQFTFNGRPSLHNWCSSLMGFFLGVSLEALRMYGIDVADYADPTVPNAVAANNVNASSSQTGAQHNPPSVPAGQGGGGQQRAQLSSREAPSLLSTQTFSPVPRVITGLDPKSYVTIAGADFDGQVFYPLGTTQHSRRCTQLPTVTLASQIGQGAAWTAFVARLRKPTPIRLVAKVHRPEADQNRERDIRKAILKEWEVVSGRLAHLQGHTIPMHYGLWESQDHTLLTIMQDVGRPILRSDWESPDIRKKVEAAVLSVYEAGVTHDDLHWGHLYIFHDEVKLIDFNMTTLLTRKTASSWLKFGQIALKDLTIVPPRV